MMSLDCPSRWPGTAGGDESVHRRGLRLLLILAGHAGVVWGGMELATRPEMQVLAQEISVRLLEMQPPKSAVKQESPPPQPRTPVRREVPPPPILAVASAAPAPAASFVVAPPPDPTPAVSPAPAEPMAPPPLPVTAARFDADYLSNPKPVYPPASRRLGEEGKVLLRVHVNTEGLPLAVEIKTSCGFPRLDESARAAVERWRFVPARRGGEAIDSWVAVPIVFSLQSS